MQYGFTPGKVSMSAVQPAREGLLMDCLYSQFVNEWALPLSKGPEAITRLGAWINGDEAASGIPFSAKGVWVHCPIEVRVSDTCKEEQSAVRPFLDPTCKTEPTLYLNATLYRPYNRDPPCRARYYEAFEWLMMELGGRPHWAKNFEVGSQVPAMYGSDMQEWCMVRGEVDPQGMFLGEWHRRVLPEGELKGCVLGEREGGRNGMGKGFGDSVEWTGLERGKGEVEEDGEKGGLVEVLREKEGGLVAERESPSPPTTATSEESFDYLAKGEASVHE